MLEQAIIDAKELKESAQKNAEEAIVEKYQLEIKEAVEKILEQEDPLGLGGDLGGGLGDDLGGAPGGKPESANQPESGKDQIDMVLEQLPFLQTTDDNEVIELDLGKLEESLNIVSEENLKDELQALSEIELDEDLLDEYMLEEDEEEDEEKDEEQDISMNDPEVAAALDDQIPIDEDLLEEYMLDEEFELDEDLDEAMVDLKKVPDDKLAALVTKALSADDTVAEDLSLEEMIAEALEEMLGEEDVLEEDEDLFEVEDLEEDEIKNPGKYIDGPRNEAGIDDDGDGVPNKVDKDSKDGAVQESKKLQKENKTLIKEQTRMSSKVQLLENKLDKYGTVIDQLKQKLDESNLASAKLLYQNRVLDSDSLNERQKDRIVEAIKDAGTVEEAKIIFETLQSTVDTTGKSGRKRESLDEVVYRGSSAFMPLKEAKQKVSDPFVARMQALAGLK